MPAPFVCAVAHTPFLAARSPDGGPELRITSVSGAQRMASPLAKTTLRLTRCGGLCEGAAEHGSPFDLRASSR